MQHRTWKQCNSIAYLNNPNGNSIAGLPFTQSALGSTCKIGSGEREGRILSARLPLGSPSILTLSSAHLPPFLIQLDPYNHPWIFTNPCSLWQKIISKQDLHKKTMCVLSGFSPLPRASQLCWVNLTHTGVSSRTFQLHWVKLSQFWNFP
ncbi:UNVERIFIED_CONTAM: hypothetical protein K2H54_061657 [Gekko kuhli]